MNEKKSEKLERIERTEGRKDWGRDWGPHPSPEKRIVITTCNTMSESIAPYIEEFSRSSSWQLARAGCMTALKGLLWGLVQRDFTLGPQSTSHWFERALASDNSVT